MTNAECEASGGETYYREAAITVPDEGTLVQLCDGSKELESLSGVVKGGKHTNDDNADCQSGFHRGILGGSVCSEGQFLDISIRSL